MSNSKPLPKNRLQDRLLRDRQDDVGLGQPNKEPKPMSPDKNSLMGYKSASTNTRNHNKNQADTMNNTGLNVTQKGILGSTVSLETSKTPLKENTEIILPFGAVAMIEQLLQESKSLQEASIGSAATVGGQGIPNRPIHQPSTKDYGDAVRAKTQINDSDQNADAKNAAAVSTNPARASYSYTNAGAKDMGAQNNARLQDRQDQKMAAAAQQG